MHPLLFEYVMLLEYVSYSCIFLFRNGGDPTLLLCRKAMFTQAVSQEAWSGGMGSYTAYEVGVNPIRGGYTQ